MSYLCIKKAKTLFLLLGNSWQYSFLWTDDEHGH